MGMKKSVMPMTCNDSRSPNVTGTNERKHQCLYLSMHGLNGSSSNSGGGGHTKAAACGVGALLKVSRCGSLRSFKPPALNCSSD